MTVIKSFFWTLVLVIISTSISQGRIHHTAKNKAGYYFHVSIHDNGSSGFINNGYPQHTYNIYTYITNSAKADISSGVIVNETFTSNLNISVSSDGDAAYKTIIKQYIINAGSGYNVDAFNAEANLKFILSSISLSTYLYNGFTIHIDYKVHYF